MALNGKHEGKGNSLKSQWKSLPGRRRKSKVKEFSVFQKWVGSHCGWAQ